MKKLSVFETRPAAAPLAGWLQRVLEPVCMAARLKPLRLEIRPTGRWRGSAPNHDDAPDGRVILSSKIVFWTNESIISVYIHEACHRLFEGRDVLTHGPEFAALNCIFLARCKEFFRLDPLFQIDLYDCQDCPAELANEPGWRGLVLNFAIETVATFADSKTDSEELAVKVIAAWQNWLGRRQRQLAAGVLHAAQAARARVLRDELSKLRQDVSVYFWVVGFGFAILFVALFYMSFLVFFR